MSEWTDDEYLCDIMEAIRRIIVFTDGLTYDRFLADIKSQDAVLRNMEIMGEAAKGLSTELKEKHPDVPWKGMAGIRDRLIHHYFGVNLDIVWDIAHTELPALKPKVHAILQEMNDGC